MPCFYMAGLRRNSKVLGNYTAAEAAASAQPNQTVPWQNVANALKWSVHFDSVRINGLCHSC